MQDMLCVECAPEIQVTATSESEEQLLAKLKQDLLLEKRKTGAKFDKHLNLNMEQLTNLPVQNTSVKHQSVQDIEGKTRQRSKSSIDRSSVRKILKFTGSMFPTRTGVRKCPFSLAGDCCDGRHCEEFWKPILKQEKRRTPLCGDECKLCHDPRHFPDDEWVKHHVHTAAARKREEKKKAKADKAGCNPQDRDAVPTKSQKHIIRDVPDVKDGCNPQDRDAV